MNYLSDRARTVAFGRRHVMIQKLADTVSLTSMLFSRHYLESRQLADVEVPMCLLHFALAVGIQLKSVL